MENLIHKTISVLETVKEPADKRMIEFIASTESMDRDGAVIKSHCLGLKQLQEEPGRTVGARLFHSTHRQESGDSG